MLKQLFSLLLISLSLYSCKPDPCKDVNCNNGLCSEGDCVCDAGYEGLNCETEQRQAFVGDFTVAESCDLGNFNYIINVTADSEEGTELTIHNIGDFDFDVVAVVNGNSFLIDNQMVNGATINGTGELSSSSLTITYTFETTGGQTLNCTMTCQPIE